MAMLEFPVVLLSQRAVTAGRVVAPRGVLRQRAKPLAVFLFPPVLVSSAPQPVACIETSQ